MCVCPECLPDADAPSALVAELTDLERQRQDRLAELERIERDRLALIRRLNPTVPPAIAAMPEVAR